MHDPALGIWPFDSGTPAAPSAAALSVKCWDESLNQSVLDACRTGGEYCKPQNLVYLLGLDYCPGTCGAGGPKLPTVAGMSTSTMVLGIGALAILGAIWWRSKSD